MNFLHAIILGIVEGLTEFLPVSSTGHLTLVEKLLGLSIDDPGVTAFTAIIQFGAIIAVIIYFHSDIARLVAAWWRGLFNAEARRNRDYRFAWYVIAGSIPIGIVGFAAKDVVSGALRNLWVVVAGLILWSVVMFIAERVGRRTRLEESLTLKDALIIGLFQCIALVPGVSRSGATISAGLLRNLDRVASTRLSFFLAIPALIGAGAYESVSQASAVNATVGWGAVAIGTIVSFIVAYASIAWLLRLVARHPITVFIWYRIALGLIVAAFLATGVITAT
ncbi:undecaprenyl-diphosphatase [Subtercola sp. Z020]|uniref:undecaprenyl-diphosphate phosphatase n=1 Tax=Subtercola sp. Z020 TaxID=2080582 RepID=UPI000CE928A2|nr:undecaprenyl-diphosphate phosphatase [Subtercola sp. Z020]PPF79307.1 undecaprenyl-diphosphatase [Subtercola sp. Z020]